MDKILDPREHLPHYYKDIREIDIIANAIIYILSNLDREMQTILANNFIQTANEAGIAKYEKILGINVDPTIDLETRRQRVLSKMAASTVFTLRVLKTNLKEICDNGEYTLDMDYDTFYMDLKVRVGRKGMLDVLYDLLYTMLPAHVGFYLHNHLPASSEGGTYYALAVSIRHTYKVVDAVSPKGNTTLVLNPGGATSIRNLKVTLDAIIDVLNSSLNIAASSAISVRSLKVISDVADKTNKTQHLSSARVISKK